MGLFGNWFGDKTERPEVSVYQIGTSFDPSKENGTIANAYTNNGDVYSIVKKIADNAKNIPRQLWKKNGDEWEQVLDGDLWRIVTQQPNEHQDIHDFIEQSITNLLIKGNTFRRAQLMPGFSDAFQEILLVNNDILTIECMLENFNYVPKHYRLELGTQKIIIEPELVNHVKFYNPSHLGLSTCLGLSPLQAGLLSLVASNDYKKAQSVIVRNQGVRGMITSRSERPMNEEQRKQIQKAADSRMIGASKFGKAITTSANVDFIQMGMNPTQLKMMEGATLTLRDLCNLYGVDSSLFNDPANQTYNNRKEAKKAMYTDAVIPVNEKDIKSLSAWLLPGWNLRDNTTYEIRQDLSGLPMLHEDEAKKAEAQNKKGNTIISILASEISDSQKVNTLMLTLGLEEEEAKALVNG